MKIVQVCPYAWSARGGVQTHIRHLSQYLDRAGHELLVLAPGDGRDRAGRSSDDPSASPIDVRLIGASIRVPFNGSTAPICFERRGALGVRDQLDRFAPDIVHVHEPLSPSLSMFATWYARAPIVATFHAHVSAPADRLLYGLAARCLRRVSRRVDVRLAVSRAAAACAASHVGGPIHVVPNGLDLRRVGPADPIALPPGRRLLVVSRLDRRKGFAVALGAFSLLASRFTDLSLIVVGDGPCRRLIDSLPPGIKGRVRMLGDVSDTVVRSVYGAVDVFMAPATGRESFGVVLLEAMAAGVPIVASDIDGYREVVSSNVNALLAPAEDVGAFADAAARLLNDAALAERLCAAGRAHVGSFAWDVVGGDLERLYRTLVDARGEAPATLRRQPLAGYVLPDATS